MRGMDDLPERDRRETGQSSDREACADPSSLQDKENGQQEQQVDIRQLLERLAESQSAALVYFDHRSEVVFNHEAYIMGDVVGRDQHKQGAIASVLLGSEAIAGYVPEEDLEKAKSVYEPPACHAHAQAVLADKHIVILCGPARWGKWTAALQLLHDIRPGRLAEINPDVTVDDLLGLDLESGVSYVLDTLPSEALQELTAPALSRLGERFRKANSHLVITAASSISLLEHAFGSHVVAWNELPDPRKVLKSHIRWRLDGGGYASALELADSTQVKQLLDGQLVPGEVDHLAEILARVAGGELDLEEGLSQFEASALSAVEKWFRMHDQPAERAFMISIAVLNGSEYEAVAAASRLLGSRIREELGDAKPMLRVVSTKPRSLRLEETHARIVEGSKKTEFGRCPVEVVVLDNPAYQPCVLRHVWRELDQLRAPVLRWLSDLNQLSSLGDRAKASAAVGELCKLDFARVMPETIKLWANDDDPQVRAAAALALGIPAWDSGHAPRVMKLLRHWSTLKNNWRLSWTAAAAYGGLAGQRFAVASLRELLGLAAREDARLRLVARDSLIRLLVSAEGGPRACFTLLKALAEGVDACQGRLSSRGLELFLELLRAEIRSDDPTRRPQPLLLRAIEQEEACGGPFLELLRRALKSNSLRQDTLAVVRALVARLEDVPELVAVAESLIGQLAEYGTDRERTRLGYHLRLWASGRGRGAKVASRLLQAAEQEPTQERRSSNGNR